MKKSQEKKLELFQEQTEARDKEKKLNLEEGEIICDKCNGRGVNPIKNKFEFPIPCNKCQGLGKLDWIENIVGKKSTTFGTTSNSTYSSISNTFNLQNSIMNDVSSAIAKQIDEEIIESLKSHIEQINIKYIKASNVFNDMGGILFDNGIVS